MKLNLPPFILILMTIILISSCVNTTNNVLLSSNPSKLVNATNVTIMFQVVDDRSQNLNYTLYRDSTIISQGNMLNNTIIEVISLLDENKMSRTFTLFAEDESGNINSANITVTIADKNGPNIVKFDILEN